MGDLKSLNSKEIINSGGVPVYSARYGRNNINMEFEKKLSYSGSGDLYVFCGKEEIISVRLPIFLLIRKYLMKSRTRPIGYLIWISIHEQDF